MPIAGHFEPRLSRSPAGSARRDDAGPPALLPGACKGQGDSCRASSQSPISKAGIRRKSAPATSASSGPGSRMPRSSTPSTGKRPSPRGAKRSQASTFQAQLGTLADKTARITALAAQIAQVAGQDPAAAQRAAELAKCDLLTAMVGEFPELQGVMGHYALNDGEPEAVANALARAVSAPLRGPIHSRRPGPASPSPSQTSSTRSSASSPSARSQPGRRPYGLRRAALGVLRILIETGIGLDLRELIRTALDSVGADLLRLGGKPPPEGLADEIYGYTMERLRAWYSRAPAVSPARCSMPSSIRGRCRRSTSTIGSGRSQVFSSCRMPPDSPQPTSASPTSCGRRANNQARASIRDCSPIPEWSASCATAVEELRQDVERLVTARRYAEALARLASLRPAVDAFFDQVLVMAEDVRVRANRLALLAALQRLLLHIVNLSRLPG